MGELCRIHDGLRLYGGVSRTQDTWLYHLMVAAGSSATFNVGTEYERLIGTLLDADGDPGEPQRLELRAPSSYVLF